MQLVLTTKAETTEISECGAIQLIYHLDHLLWHDCSSLLVAFLRSLGSITPYY